ncbi:MAG: 50S ribosomal protein L24 [Candidatus Hydrogenedentota bacterium]|nr:MAG: 50S ribosomal protein L24 [Candidatus Hydrogenedentota bacterium]
MAVRKQKSKEPSKIKTKLKVDDEVIVISGKHKKARGKILAIDKKRGRVVVQGVNLRKFFVPPTQENPKGGVMEIERPIHISNVMFYDSKAKAPSRIKMGVDKNGKKVRIAVKSGKEID